MNSTIQAQAFAKINWDLRILGKRPDNFHELDSIFVTVGLNDSLRFEDSVTLSMTCSDPTLPTDDSNLVMKAAARLAQAAGCKAGARIHLEKRIPMGGGMGGGSSDAACALSVLNQLWALNWHPERLAAIAAEVGSDVAYFLTGGWCLCRGRGEIVARLPFSSSWPAVKLVMILPPLHVATPSVYRALNAHSWDGLGGRNARETGERLGEKLRAMSDATSREPMELRNDLSTAARAVEPRLGAVQSVLQKYFPERWLMSGSGASHFALVPPDPVFNMDALSADLQRAVPGSRIVETNTRSE